MSINNIQATTDAIKYINGIEVEPKKASIASDVKATVTSPLNLVFGYMDVSAMTSDIFQGSTSALATTTAATTAAATAGAKKGLFSGIKNTINTLKNVGNVQMGDLINGKALRSTNDGKQLSQTVTNIETRLQTKTAQKAAQAAAQGGKTGILATIKSGLKAAGSKVGSVLSKIPGASKVANVCSKIGSSKFGSVMKGTGAVGMMVINGALGVITEVIPAFKQGGAKAGVKQIGKTAVNTAGTGLGWAGGSVAGEAIGAAIGSIFPGAGTIIGAGIGKFLGGMIGSAIGSGVAKKITGKSEVEKLQEKQYEQAATEIANDPEAMQELNQLVTQQVQTEMANGTANENTQKMLQYLNSGALASNNNPYVSTPVATELPGTSSSAVDMTTYWNDLAQRIQQGDTSMYKISDSKLNSVFAGGIADSSATMAQQQKELENSERRYFATA